MTNISLHTLLSPSEVQQYYFPHFAHGKTEAEVKQLAHGHRGKPVAEAETGAKASCVHLLPSPQPFPSPSALLILLVLRFNPPFSG